MQSITGVILSGGKSLRIGENKAFLRICGKRIIDRIFSIINTVFEETILVTNNISDYLYLGCEVVKDIFPEKGPAVGILTGLFFSRSEYIFVSPNDMPFLNREVIDHICSKKGNYDVIVPFVDDKWHPLFGLYRKNIVHCLHRFILEGHLKIIDLFPRLRVLAITEQELSKFDPSLGFLLNINTREDFRKAQELAKLYC